MKETKYLKVVGVFLIIFGALSILGTVMTLLAPIPDEVLKQIGATAFNIRSQAAFGLITGAIQVYLGFKVFNRKPKFWLYTIIFIGVTYVLNILISLLFFQGMQIFTAKSLIISLIIPGITALLLYLGRNEHSQAKTDKNDAI
ncbi:MAG: hypothetical protein UT66_C0001G0029 [candidate division CPR2 bacterium GW2011_GWC1_39_9]|uniref:Uncharacterized protein n=1 Tax=candidate division CPR2 bacterium GW2011_GWC2_39_10 TaxID=1618345 RepID=A0A0G0PBD2_UNCC2|nr:MAG: hypothetical protein UT18_C0001G0031 [candidate division CPR2 bacterium GW2011_GWC2_39_10]KKR36205.1 MAG: hypothetical protein UT66_C0001G0029 [candidate division CPR2 bacterium GW2011_GWC1_39_9]